MDFWVCYEYDCLESFGLNGGFGELHGIFHNTFSVFF